MSGEICAYCYEPITEICWCNPDNQLTQAQARIKELEGVGEGDEEDNSCSFA